MHAPMVGRRNVFLGGAPAPRDPNPRAASQLAFIKAYQRCEAPLPASPSYSLRFFRSAFRRDSASSMLLRISASPLSSSNAVQGRVLTASTREAISPASARSAFLEGPGPSRSIAESTSASSVKKCSTANHENSSAAFLGMRRAQSNRQFGFRFHSKNGRGRIGPGRASRPSAGGPLLRQEDALSL